MKAVESAVKVASAKPLGKGDLCAGAVQAPDERQGKLPEDAVQFSHASHPHAPWSGYTEISCKAAPREGCRPFQLHLVVQRRHPLRRAHAAAQWTEQGYPSSSPQTTSAFNQVSRVPKGSATLVVPPKRVRLACASDRRKRFIEPGLPPSTRARSFLGQPIRHFHQQSLDCGTEEAFVVGPFLWIARSLGNGAEYDVGGIRIAKRRHDPLTVEHVILLNALSVSQRHLATPRPTRRIRVRIRDTLERATVVAFGKRH
jgi:hypothetical protein